MTAMLSNLVRPVTMLYSVDKVAHPLKMRAIPFLRISILASLCLSSMVSAAPSHFPVVIGSALTCRDQINVDYFNDYMKTFFGNPAFVAGGANWWKVSESIFNSPVEYVFVGSGLDFIGATFKDNPEKLIANVRDSMGMEYRRTGAEKWEAPTSGILIKYYDKNASSKMYCFGSPHTPY